MAFHNSAATIPSLKTNPFFILNIPVSANRRIITAAVDEMSFMLDPDICSEAQQELLTPDRRLAAELDWFIDVDNRSMASIRESIDRGTEISYDNLCGLSRLNVLLYNLDISGVDDSLSLGYEIVEISNTFSSLKRSEILSVINRIHGEAKLPIIDENDMAMAIQKKRESIRTVIGKKLEALAENDYVELITLLAKKSFEDGSARDRIIIEDLIDQYELNMQPQISLKTDVLNNVLQYLDKITDKSEIGELFDSLSFALKKWYPLVYPIQIKSQYVGIPDQSSETIAREIRNAALYLHNEKSYTNEAISLLETTKPYFEHIKKLYAIFEEDIGILKENLKGQKEAEELIKKIEDVKAKAEYAKKEGSYYAVDRLILAMRELNAELKKCGLPKDQIISLREMTCLCCRDAAISMHNTNQQTRQAYVLIQEIVKEFPDLKKVSSQLIMDYTTLRRMISPMELAALEKHDPTGKTQTASSIYQSTSSHKSDNGSKKGLFIAVAIIAALVFFAFFAYSPENSNSSQTPTTHVSNHSDNKKPPETLFKTSLSTGTDVYASISTIFPSLGIYTEGNSFYSYFVCECTTTTGSTIWVYMTVTEYRNYFDSDASNSIYNSEAEEIELVYPKKIHGTVVSSESVLGGLSSEIGVNRIFELDRVG